MNNNWKEQNAPRVEADHYELPIADIETGITSYTKQSFWFNKDFVEKMIKD